MLGHAASPVPLHVVIAGGGVAALETLLALRAVAEERVTIELLSPEDEYTYRPLEVGGAFALGNPRRYSLAAIADSRGATLRHDALVGVDVEGRTAMLQSGEQLDFGALVVAVGARAVSSVPGAHTYRGRQDHPVMRHLLSEVSAGAVGRLAFVVPTGVAWPLPAYELALMTAAAAEAANATTEIVLVTPEDRPLELFGVAASDEVARVMDARGVRFVGSAHPTGVVGDSLLLRPGSTDVLVDRVVALSSLVGRTIPGLQSSPDGFLRTDQHGRVRGANRVWAAGDATDFAIKQGGIATQQADAVGEDIAALAGAPVTPAPFRPVLRGMLLTGDVPRYLRATIAGGAGDDSTVSDHALWWPPSKIAGRYLTPYLGASDEDLDARPGPHTGVPIEVELEHEWAAAHPVRPTPPSHRAFPGPRRRP
jgi:sulfide:quinone oxidoreductase